METIINNGPEKTFLELFIKLSEENQRQWTMSMYDNGYAEPDPSFLNFMFGVEQNLDKLAKVLCVLDLACTKEEDKADYKNSRRCLENTLIQIFASKVKNCETHPWEIMSFLFLFTNRLPQESEKTALIDALDILVSSDTWRDIRVGARLIVRDARYLSDILKTGESSVFAVK